MAVVELKAGPGKLAKYGKKKLAAAMFHKGAQFVSASLLLKQKSGLYDVVLHLLAQGLEVMQKGLLLACDYDTFHPQLRKLGHDLVKGDDALRVAFKLKPMKKDLRAELKALNRHYSAHSLRYAGLDDLFGIPTHELKADLVLRQAAALTLLARKVFR